MKTSRWKQARFFIRVPEGKMTDTTELLFQAEADLANILVVIARFRITIRVMHN